MSGPSIDTADHEFAQRAAVYLRDQGLSDDEVRSALVVELGLPGPEAAALAITGAA